MTNPRRAAVAGYPEPMLATPEWRSIGREPDYRFSLANERTFLAWLRTSLAILAGGLLLHELVSSLPKHLLLFTLIGLSALAAVISAVAYQRWRANEIAMRMDAPLPHSRTLALLSAIVLAMSSSVAILAVM